MAAALLLSWPLLAFLDLWFWHPGFSSVDEIQGLREAWEVKERGLEAAAFTGSVARALQASCLRLSFSPLVALLPSVVFFFLENILLFLICRRLFSERAALGAVIFNAASAYSLLRLRTVFSWALLPYELAAVLALLVLRSGPSRLRDMAAGFLLALWGFDYDAIIAAWLGFGLALPWLWRERGMNPAAFGLGFAIAAVPLILTSLPWLESSLALRQVFTFKLLPGESPPFSNLFAFFLGGPQTLPSLAVQDHPALPWWSLALVLLGIAPVWKQARGILWLALAGLLPLLLPTAGLTEANRAVAAWLPLCLMAGAGWDAAYARMGARSLAGTAAVPRLRAGLILLALAGSLWEAKAFLRSQEALEPLFYVPFQATQAAAKYLKPHLAAGRIRILTNMGPQRASELEWLCGGSGSEQAFQEWAWIPAEALRALGPEAGEWIVFSDPKQRSRVFLLAPDEPWRSQLRECNRFLASIEAAVPKRRHLENLDHLAFLLDRKEVYSHQQLRDPWVRTVLWQRRMILATILNQADKTLVDRLLSEKLLHSGPLRHPALYLRRHDPKLAAHLARAAQKMDQHPP